MLTPESPISQLRKAYRGAVVRQRFVVELVKRAASCLVWLNKEVLIRELLHRLECEDDWSQDYFSLSEEFDKLSPLQVVRDGATFYGIRPFLTSPDDSLMSALRQASGRMFVSTNFDLTPLEVPKFPDELPANVSDLELSFMVSAYKTKLGTLLSDFKELATTLNYYPRDILDSSRPVQIGGIPLEVEPEFPRMFEQLRKAVDLPFTQAPASHFSSESKAQNTVKDPLKELAVLAVLVEESA